MLLKSKDGIRCDLCGMTFKDKFVYYSVSFLEGRVDASRLLTMEVKEKFDLDACEGCLEKVTDKVKGIDAKDTNLTITCRHCGKVMSNKFTYYLFKPTKVTADKDVTEEGPANVERDIFEVPICSTCGNFFKDKKAEIRKKHQTGEEWS